MVGVTTCYPVECSVSYFKVLDERRAIPFFFCFQFKHPQKEAQNALQKHEQAHTQTPLHGSPTQTSLLNRVNYTKSLLYDTCCGDVGGWGGHVLTLASALERENILSI